MGVRIILLRSSKNLKSSSCFYSAGQICIRFEPLSFCEVYPIGMTRLLTHLFCSSHGRDVIFLIPWNSGFQSSIDPTGYLSCKSFSLCFFRFPSIHQSVIKRSESRKFLPRISNFCGYSCYGDFTESCDGKKDVIGVVSTHKLLDFPFQLLNSLIELENSFSSSFDLIFENRDNLFLKLAEKFSEGARGGIFSKSGWEERNWMKFFLIFSPIIRRKPGMMALRFFLGQFIYLALSLRRTLINLGRERSRCWLEVRGGEGTHGKALRYRAIISASILSLLESMK